MGEIPVLEQNGVRLTQTAPILLKLAEQYGRFGGESAAEQYEVLRWLFWDNHKLTGYMASYRYYRTFTASRDPHLLAYFRKRLDDFLGILEQHLKQSAFAVGDRPTVADISMIAYLHYPSDETGVTRPSAPGSAASPACPAGGQPTICCPASVLRITPGSNSIMLKRKCFSERRAGLTNTRTAIGRPERGSPAPLLFWLRC